MEEKTKKKPQQKKKTKANESINRDNCVFKEAIERYISLLNSQMDSYPIIINTLAANVKASANNFNKFLKENSIKKTENEENNEIKYEVPIELGKEFVRLQDELSNSINAYSLIPKNIVVAMVSLYDAYLAEIIECAYTIKPQLLNASGREFSISEIIKFNSIEELKKHVIEKDVESIIRESHNKQLDLLSKKFDVKLTKNLPCYNDFIEITERRNLFVHTNGKVSSQYKATCKDRPIDHKNEDVQIGEELFATPMYIEHCYKTLFEIGVKLGQVVWRKLEKDLEKADDSLIDIGYELIKSRKYSLACIMMDFSCESYVKHYNKACEYVLCVNRALAYYLKGDKDKCKDIINCNDWSGTELRYQLAYNVLLEQYDKAIIIMKKIGKTDEMRYACAEWPLFNQFRRTEQFKLTYKSIFGCDYQYIEHQATRWEDTIKEAMEMIKDFKERKLKKAKQKATE